MGSARLAPLMAADGSPTLQERLDERRDKKWTSFSWVTLRALSSSVNHALGHGAPRLVTELRKRWMGQLPEGRRIVELRAASSFLIVGDPGEQDASQYVVAAAMEEHADVDFVVICSDVIYPAGDVNDYVDGFYVPYRRFGELAKGARFFAVPGNHDWYDSLFGFMWTFCGPELKAPSVSTSGFTLRERLAWLAWKRPKPPQRTVLQMRAESSINTGQPGPYFAIDLPNLRIVCIDTGIVGGIDSDQGQWLLDVSGDPVDKVLVTGKPLMVNTHVVTCEIEDGAGGFASVNDIVAHPGHRYVAAIGGDIHNFQHYAEGMSYIVSGGGGAYLSATHTMERPADASKVALYPTREASLGHFSQLFVPPTWRVLRAASAMVAGVLAAYVAVRASSDTTLELVLQIGSIALAAWVVVTFLLPPKRNEIYRAALLVVALIGGLVAGLAGWWVAPGAFETNVQAAGALIAGGCVIAVLLRLTAWWRPGDTQRLALLGWLVLGTAGIVALVLVDESRLAVAAGLVVGAGLVGGVLRSGTIWTETVAAVTAGVVQLLVALLVIYDWPVRAAGVQEAFNDVVIALGAVVVALVLVTVISARRLPFVVELPIAVVIVGAAIFAVWWVWGRPVGVALATPAVLLGLAIAVDGVRARVPGALYRPVFIFGLAGLVAGGAYLAQWRGIDVEWVPEAAAGAAVIVAVTVVGIAIAHLFFLGAIPLLWRWHIRSGVLEPGQDAEGMKWRDGLANSATRVTKHVVNIVHPGAKRPRGPLHKLVSEICDIDEPPFAKSFLRVDVGPDALQIVCHQVTGVAGEVVSTSKVPTIELKPGR